MQKRLGKYTIIERLGGGGMAEVFKAKLYGPERFQKDVAIKLMLPHLSDVKEFEQMFITGSDSLFNGWVKAIPMKKTSIDDSNWEIELKLKDGEIKFRTDDTWKFNWGVGFRNNKNLVFEGTNIPVSAGHYRITIDIQEGTYKFVQLDK